MKKFNSTNIFEPEEVYNHLNIELEYFFNNVNIVQINSNAPKVIIKQIEALKHLIIFTYYCYDLHPVAQLYSFTIIEHALKIRLSQDSGGLNRLLKMAVNNKLISDFGFKYLASSGTDTNGYCERLIESTNKIRNIYAHGTESINYFTIFNLAICADIVNQLFEE